ncbi:MAG: hypothetical protein WBF84_06735 [Castellaniella sp.]|uniref:hypothetical protein n=1 Tax=Castellaniella sp. TaxID=1955812 RepID=UPI003C718035
MLEQDVQLAQALQVIGNTLAALRLIAKVQDPVFDAVPADSPQQQHVELLRSSANGLQHYLAGALQQVAAVQLAGEQPADPLLPSLADAAASVTVH